MAQLGDNALNADSEIVLANGKKLSSHVHFQCI